MQKLNDFQPPVTLVDRQHTAVPLAYACRTCGKIYSLEGFAHAQYCCMCKQCGVRIEPQTLYCERCVRSSR